jgi:hypothetical protein
MISCLRFKCAYVYVHVYAYCTYTLTVTAYLILCQIVGVHLIVPKRAAVLRCYYCAAAHALTSFVMHTCTSTEHQEQARIRAEEERLAAIAAQKADVKNAALNAANKQAAELGMADLYDYTKNGPMQQDSALLKFTEVLLYTSVVYYMHCKFNYCDYYD